MYISLVAVVVLHVFPTATYYSRCHSATQSLSSSTTASVCRSSSTHVLSYARHSSIISINDSDSSKRIIRLRFVSLSLSTHSLTLLLAHSLSVLAPATLRTVSVCVCMCVCCCTRQNTITRIYSHSRSLPPATTAPTTRRAHRNSSHLCMICVFHSRSPPLSLTLSFTHVR